ncbi:MAG: hypothetical protein OSA81_13765, partial [Longimicrobiales bacterium]|nr:hypothetical protein [Longimicrobiales bacterium]
MHRKIQRMLYPMACWRCRARRFPQQGYRIGYSPGRAKDGSVGGSVGGLETLGFLAFPDLDDTAQGVALS